LAAPTSTSEQLDYRLDALRASLSPLSWLRAWRGKLWCWFLWPHSLIHGDLRRSAWHLTANWGSCLWTCLWRLPHLPGEII